MRTSQRDTRAGWGMAVVALAASVTLLAAEPVRIRPSLSANSLARDWTLDGSGTWAVREGLLALVTAGKPGGPIRRPAALAIVNGPDLAETTLELEVR
jgi:hypothetical protein